MHLDVIDDYDSFLALKDPWDSVYADDPEAQFYLSWTWMTKWLDAAISEWVVLAARDETDGDRYVAFLPLRIRAFPAKNGTFYTEIWMAAQGIADYVGFLCRAGAEEQALPALANYVKTLKWNGLNLRCFDASDARMKLWTDAFPRSDFKLKRVTSTNNEEGYDNAICPYVTLPDDWDTYLDNQVSANTRQKIRRFLRKVENDDAYRITVTDKDSLESDYEVLQKLWDDKWGESKGEAATQIFGRIRRIMLTHCLEHDALFMPILWHGDKAVGALGSIVDTVKKSMLFMLAGRDLKAKGVPSGLVLHAYSIRYAIENGFKTYDFMRGNEPYKYSFGSKERLVKYMVVERKVAGNQLDPRCVGSATLLTQRTQAYGQWAQAERGYRQILKAQPDNEEVQTRLDQVLSMKSKPKASGKRRSA
ncbi:MAG: GNAT family N-acetyltransferase [Pseudomonadota bacterium]